MKIPKGYRQITLEELESMVPTELEQLLSVCYKKGKHRTECIGIHSLVTKKYETDVYVEWSDKDGDPNVRFRVGDFYMTGLYGFDSTWTYGLFKKL